MDAEMKKAVNGWGTVNSRGAENNFDWSIARVGRFGKVVMNG